LKVKQDSAQRLQASAHVEQVTLAIAEPRLMKSWLCLQV
jgi:hypothetical protein